MAEKNKLSARAIKCASSRTEDTRYLSNKEEREILRLWHVEIFKSPLDVISTGGSDRHFFDFFDFWMVQW